MLKSIADFFIAFLDLIEAEAISARRGIVVLGAVLMIGLAATLLILSALGLLMWALLHHPGKGYGTAGCPFALCVGPYSHCRSISMPRAQNASLSVREAKAKLRLTASGESLWLSSALEISRQSPKSCMFAAFTAGMILGSFPGARKTAKTLLAYFLENSRKPLSPFGEPAIGKK